MDQSASPATILVKKPDGTYVRITREEFLRQKAKEKMNQAADISLKKTLPKPAGPSAVSVAKPLETPLARKASQMPISEASLAAPRAEPKPTETAWQSDDHKSLLDPAFHDEIEKESTPASHMLATTTPVSDIFVAEAAAAERKPLSRPTAPAMPASAKTALNKIMMDQAPTWTPRKDATSPGRVPAKPMLHDVQPAAPRRVSMGPVDELRSFTLVDFRRLGGAMPERERVLLEKFTVLRNESYLLYMDGLRAWKESPLYRGYLSIIDTALSKSVPVNSVALAAPAADALSQDEFLSLIRFHRQIG